MDKEYALALMRSLQNGTDEEKLVAGLMKHLEHEGRMKLLPGILQELKALYAANAKTSSSLEIASEEERASAQAAATAAGITAEQITINPSLIKGWRARSGSVLIDHSAKQALVDLYQKITN